MGSICIKKKEKVVSIKSSIKSVQGDLTEEMLPEPFQSERQVQWKLGEIIAERKFCKIYQCINVKTGELLVLKSYTTARSVSIFLIEMKKIKKEARILRSLEHKNIIKLHQVESTSESVNLIIECIPGGCLEEIVRKYGGLEEEIVKSYMKQLAEAVYYLSSVGISHNWLACENVFVTAEGVVKLAGFKNCTVFQNSIISDNEMNYQSVDEINQFLAPEVLNGSVHRNSDIWSLGCLAIHLITGKEAFSELKKNHSSKNFKAEIPKCSGMLKSFIESCLKVDPDERASIREIINGEIFTGKNFSFDGISEESLKASLSRTTDCNNALVEMNNE